MSKAYGEIYSLSRVSPCARRVPCGEFKAYRRAAGRVMGYAYLDVMVPLYLEHREFIPEGLNL